MAFTTTPRFIFPSRRGWRSNRRSRGPCSVQNSAANPLTLASRFQRRTEHHHQHFRGGSQLPHRLCPELAALDAKGPPRESGHHHHLRGREGTRLQQQFLPNTYPAGAANPCPACPSGYAYLARRTGTPRANSIQIRSCDAGCGEALAAEASYTYSKSIDNGSPRHGSRTVTAQNWLAPGVADRGLSNFDQRHLFNLQGAVHNRNGQHGGMGGGWKGGCSPDGRCTV